MNATASGTLIDISVVLKNPFWSVTVGGQEYLLINQDQIAFTKGLYLLSSASFTDGDLTAPSVATFAQLAVA